MSHSNSAHVKVQFDIEPDEDRYPSVQSESLWAMSLGDCRYQIDNIPFYIRGVSVGDVVTAAPGEDGAFNFQSIAARGGHSTIRMLVTDERNVTVLRDELRALVH